MGASGPKGKTPPSVFIGRLFFLFPKLQATMAARKWWTGQLIYSPRGDTRSILPSSKFVFCESGKRR